MQTGKHVNTHEYLASYFSKITKQFLEDEIILTPFFNIGKDVPEVLNKYRKLLNLPTRFGLAKYIFQFSYRLIISLCKPVLHHLYNLKGFQAYKSQIPNSANKIYLSHYTSDSTQFIEPDPYFGGLISLNRIEGLTRLVLLINHTKKSLKPSERSKALNNTLYLILPKTVDSRAALRIYIKQLNFFWRILLKALKKEEIGSNERCLMFELAIQQLSQSAFSQQYLFLNASRAVLKSNAHEFNLTFEGHSFETYLARKLRESSKMLIINIIQFAPVVPSQYSFYHNLELLPADVNIYAAGRSMVKQILKLTNVSLQRIKIIGSNKYKKDIKLKNKARPRKLTVLFAPEGFLSSFAEFASMAEYCASTLKEYNFIIRAHPSSKKYKKRIIRKYLSKNTNLILSNSSLEADLSKSDICIYRSSAVGIEGMQYGLIPIHLSRKFDGSVDPIRSDDLKHPRVHDKDELINALEECRKMSAKDFSKMRFQAIRVFSEYFNEILV